jgi:3-hydroxyisobutyrate dehydrogenase
MGGPMAVRLAKAGLPVNVFGRNKQRLTPALSAGAVECSSAKDVAARSDIVFTCLTDTAAVEQVVFDANGIAEGGKAGSLLIDTSTISPDRTIEMAQRLRDVARMGWLDAPISGGTVGATDGTLSIFVGGREQDFARALPVLEYIGRNITRMGEVGAGQTTKLINQILVCCSVAMLAEAVGLAERMGLDTTAIPGALSGGRGDSAAMKAYWLRLAQRDYTSLSTVTSMMKDIELVQTAARKVGAPLPLTSTVREYNQVLINTGHGDEDLTSLARLLGKQ